MSLNSETALKILERGQKRNLLLENLNLVTRPILASYPPSQRAPISIIPHPDFQAKSTIILGNRGHRSLIPNLKEMFCNYTILKSYPHFFK